MLQAREYVAAVLGTGVVICHVFSLKSYVETLICPRCIRGRCIKKIGGSRVVVEYSP